MPATAFYASILALLFAALSIRTLRTRRNLRIPVGDGGNPEMLRAMRVHANFAEYVPFCLLMMYLVEASGAHGSWVHGMGLCLVAGRMSHAFGVSRVNEDFRFRVFGMALTLTVLIGAAGYLLLSYAIKVAAQSLG